MSFIMKSMVYVSISLFIVQQIAVQQTPSPLRYYARLIVYTSTLATVASYSFVAALVMTLLGRPCDTNHLGTHLFYSIVNILLGLKVEIEGEEYLETKPAVYMSNHQSMVDVLILGR